MVLKRPNYLHWRLTACNLRFLGGVDPTSAEHVYERLRERGVKIIVFREIFSCGFFGPSARHAEMCPLEYDRTICKQLFDKKIILTDHNND